MMSQGGTNTEPDVAETAGTVTDAVFGDVARWGDRPAVLDLDGGEHIGYARLAEAVRRGACGLLRRGLRQGDAVGIDVVPSPECAAAVYAVLAAGGVVVPVGGDDPVADGAHLSEHDVRLLLAAPGRADAAIALADRSRVRQVIALGEGDGPAPLAGLAEDGPGPENPLSPESPALLPVGAAAPDDHRAVLDRMDRLSRVTEPTDLDVVLVAGPPGDGVALLAVLSLALRRGATVLTAASMDLDRARRVIADQRVRLALLSAPIVSGLAAASGERWPCPLAAALSSEPPLIATAAHQAAEKADAIV